MNFDVITNRTLSYELKVSRRNQYYTIAVVTFIFYLIFLTQAIVYKFNLAQLTPNKVVKSIIWIPFYSYKTGSFIFIGTLKNVLERLFNVVAFIPYGIYLAILFPRERMRKLVLPIFLTTLAYEIFQFFSGYGYCETLDLINNTLGGFIGLVIGKKLVNKYMTHRSVALVNTITLIILVPLVILIYQSIQTNFNMFK